MFQVQIGDTKINIRFSHGIKKGFYKHYGYANWDVTRCSMKFVGGISYFRYGYSVRSKEDAFNANAGRKAALTRAIKEAPRSTRKIIWNAYFEARGHVD